MSYIPERSLLRGLSVDVAEQFGKPHINAWYTSNNINSYQFNHEASCPVCGNRVTNVHHCPPKSKGKLELHGHVLMPSLFALCGSGVSGCHGMIHQRLIIPTWKWHSDNFAEAWWNGWLFEELEPHSTDLYKYGEWAFKKNF